MKIIQIYCHYPEFSDSQPQLKYSCLDNFENRERVKKYIKAVNARQKKDDLHRVEYYAAYDDVKEQFEPDSALVTFFKESGKYYCEELINMPYTVDGLPSDYFKKCLKDHLQGKRLNDMIAVCLKPNHRLACPVMVRVKDIYELSGKVSEASRA